MKTIALESVDFFQKEWKCLEKHEGSDSMSRVAQYLVSIQIKSSGVHEIDVRPDGNGFWGQRIRQNNPRVDGYELKINPQNESYYLPHPEGGYVQFENMINSTVQDGKLVMQQKSFYHVNDMPDFAKNKVLEEARRQIDAAGAIIRSNGLYQMKVP